MKDVIDQVEFDTIYHEHLFYLSLTALDRLMRGHALMIQDVERLSFHGSSLRVFAGHHRPHQAGDLRRSRGIEDAGRADGSISRSGPVFLEAAQNVTPYPAPLLPN